MFHETFDLPPILVRIIYPVLLAEERYTCQCHDDQEQKPGNGTCHTHFITLKGIVIYQKRYQCSGTKRSSLSYDKRTIEFLELVAQLGNEIIENNRCDKWNGYTEKLSPFSCSVNGCCLIQIL